MATNDELSEQLKLTQKLTSLLRQADEYSTNMENSFSNQVSSVQTLNTQLAQFSTKNVISEIEKLTEAYDELLEKVEDYSKVSNDEFQDIIEDLEESTEATEDLSTGMQKAKENGAGMSEKMGIDKYVQQVVLAGS